MPPRGIPRQADADMASKHLSGFVHGERGNLWFSTLLKNLHSLQLDARSIWFRSQIFLLPELQPSLRASITARSISRQAEHKIVALECFLNRLACGIARSDPAFDW